MACKNLYLKNIKYNKKSTSNMQNKTTEIIIIVLTLILAIKYNLKYPETNNSIANNSEIEKNSNMDVIYSPSSWCFRCSPSHFSLSACQCSN